MAGDGQETHGRPPLPDESPPSERHSDVTPVQGQRPRDTRDSDATDTETSTPDDDEPGQTFAPYDTEAFTAAVIAYLDRHPMKTQGEIAQHFGTYRNRVKRALERAGRRTETRQQLATRQKKASQLPPKDRLPTTLPRLQGSERAKEQAKAEVDKLSADAVADEAVELRSFDVEAGKWLRQKWDNAGLRSEFPSPIAMVDEAFVQWWEHRGTWAEDDRIIHALRDEVDALKAQLNPNLRQQKAAEVVFQSVFAAAISGQPLTPEAIKVLREEANRWAGVNG